MIHWMKQGARRLARGGRVALTAAVLAVVSFALPHATPPAHAVQVTVTHWGVLMYGAPYAVAIEKGFYNEAGVDVTGVLTSKGGGTTMRNVMAAEMPYGEVALSAVIAAINQGVDLKIVHTGVQTVGEILWVTMPDSPIRTVADMAGKKVAFTSPKSVTDMLLTMVTDKHGVKVDAVAAGGIGAGLTMLQQGGVVAAPIMDPVWARMQDRFRPVFMVKDELAQMTQTVGVTTAEFASANADTLRALIKARKRGVEFIYENPKEAADIVAKHYEIDPALALRAIENLIPLEYWGRGEFNIDAMNNMIGGLRIIGEVEGDVDWNKFVDASFLD